MRANENIGSSTYIAPTAPPTAIERARQDRENGPPVHPGVLRRALEIACLVTDTSLNRLVYDADFAMAERTNRKRRLLISGDLAPYLTNQGILPPGVEAEVAGQLMPRLTEVFQVQTWEQFKHLAATKWRTDLENTYRLHERGQTDEQIH